MATRSTRRTSAAATAPPEKSNNSLQPDSSLLTNLECLILAQTVYEYGANAWAAVAKTLSKHPLLSRPKQFFTAQSCLAIYTRLMHEAELECSDANNAPHAPLNVKLAQRHYSARLLELRDLISAEEVKFKRIVAEIDDIQAGRWDDTIKAKLASVEGEVVDLTQPEPVQEAENDEPVLPEVQIPDEPVESELSGITDIEETAPPQASPPVVEEQSQVLLQPEEIPEAQQSAEEEQNEHEPTDDMPDLALPSSDPVDPLPTTEIQEVVENTEITPPDTAATPAGDGVEEGQAHAVVEIGDNPDGVAMDVDEPHPVEEPLLSQQREGKRKVSEVEDTAHDILRETKRPREESEPVDEDEQANATTGSARRRRGTTVSEQPQPPIPNKRFQTVITMLHAQISQHRNGNIFHNPIKNSEAPDYHEIIKRPMDLKTIKARIKDGVIANSDDFQRDIYLMFANAMMYNRPGSDIYHMAEEMMIEAEGHINAFRQTEGLMRTRS